MDSLFKKVVYTGVGLVATTAERLQSTVSEFVSKGKLSEDEGKKVVDDFIADLEAKREDFEGKINELVNKVVHSLEFPSRSELERLRERVKELENQFAETPEGEAETPAAPTEAPRKSVKKVSAKKDSEAK